MAMCGEGPEATLQATDGDNLKVVCRKSHVSESLHTFLCPNATVSHCNAGYQRSPAYLTQNFGIHVLHGLCQVYLRKRGSGSNDLNIKNPRLTVPFDNEVRDSLSK